MITKQTIKGVATGWDCLAIFVTIKNTEYAGSGDYEITKSGYEDLPSLGWDYEKEYGRYDDVSVRVPIREMLVGDILCGEYGVCIIRVA